MQCALNRQILLPFTHVHQETFTIHSMVLCGCPIICTFVPQYPHLNVLYMTVSRFELSCMYNVYADKWSPALQMRTVLLSIQALLSAPNPDDPLANDVADQWKKDEAKAIETGTMLFCFSLCLLPLFISLPLLRTPPFPSSFPPSIAPIHPPSLFLVSLHHYLPSLPSYYILPPSLPLPVLTLIFSFVSYSTAMD